MTDRLLTRLFIGALVLVALGAAPAQAITPKPHLIVHGSPSALTGANSATSATGLSADGTFALIESKATDVLPGFADHDGASGDIYRVNLHSGAVELVSQSVADGANSGNAASGSSVLSPNGRFVMFTSTATDLVPAFTDHDGTGSDVFMRDMDTGQTTLVSHKVGLPAETGNEYAYMAALRWSSDSRYLVFFSTATDLVSGHADAAGSFDAFRYDRVANTTDLVTVKANGAAGSFGDALNPSADGEHITFDAPDTGFVTPFTNNNGGNWDVYERDMTTGTTKLVSGAGGSPSAGANGGCNAGPTSADGSAVAFGCDGTNLVAGFADNNGTGQDAYLHQAGVTTLLSGAGGSATQGANQSAYPRLLSPDHTFAVLSTAATNLMPGFVDGNGSNGDVYLRDIGGTGVRLLTASTAGATHGANADSLFSGSSTDGRTLLVSSAATDLAPGFTVPPSQDQIYRFDAATGAASLVSGSGSSGGDQSSANPEAGADGSVIAYRSEASNLVAGFVDANGIAGDTFATFGIAPVARATAKATTPLTASFDGSGSSDLDGSIAQYAWNFGDGKTATGPAVTHAYAKGGAHTATLTVTDDSGNPTSTTVNVTVAGRPHVALTLGGRLKQHIGAKGLIRVTARCNVRCRIGAAGTLTGGFGKLKPPKVATARARHRIVLKLRVPKGKRAAVRRALSHKKKVSAKLRVRATATGLLPSTKRRTVKLRL
jgi:chitodextrinase